MCMAGKVHEKIADIVYAEDSEDVASMKIIDALLQDAISSDASDIHIEPTADSVAVRYRIDGVLHDAMVLPKTVLGEVVTRIKMLSNLNMDEHRLPQYGRFTLESDDYNIAFQVSTLPVFDGEKIVMRLLDESGKGLLVGGIGMSASHLAMFKHSITKPHGMMVVAGPAGSGKTTTLYAALRELNTQDVNISTIEDPVEYRMERVNQTQIQPHIGLTFPHGIRAAVRQDPDVIMVGEIRDKETASLAAHTALTGHGVLSTLHANNAAGAIVRLLDMGIEPFLLSSTLNLVIAQRLVRTLCDSCKKMAPMDDAMKNTLADIVNMDHMLKLIEKDSWDSVVLYAASGCSQCRGGYKGRMGIYEMFEMTDSIQRLVSSPVAAHDITVAVREDQDMISMLEDGIMKAVQGSTSVEEVVRVANE